jgi:hypothetical protein
LQSACGEETEKNCFPSVIMLASKRRPGSDVIVHFPDSKYNTPGKAEK